MPRVTPLPAAVLWDLDGTIVDTEPLWFAAELRLAAAYGVRWSEEDHAALVGSDLLAAGAFIRDFTGIPLAPEQIVERMVADVCDGLDRAVEWRPGARELLAGLRTAGVACALVTMSYREIAERVVARLPERTFDVVVTGEEVRHGKPHPEPYLTAARRLGVAVRDCVVIEDSATGTASGAAAGAHVIAVPNVVAVPDRPGMVTLETLEGVAPDGLLMAFDRARLDPV
jgi:HAD superfamily hydrolase (TIGR01509 family)